MTLSCVCVLFAAGVYLHVRLCVLKLKPRQMITRAGPTLGSFIRANKPVLPNRLWSSKARPAKPVASGTPGPVIIIKCPVRMTFKCRTSLWCGCFCVVHVPSRTTVWQDGWDSSRSCKQCVVSSRWRQHHPDHTWAAAWRQRNDLRPFTLAQTRPEQRGLKKGYEWIPPVHFHQRSWSGLWEWAQWSPEK